MKLRKYTSYQREGTEQSSCGESMAIERLPIPFPLAKSINLEILSPK